MGVMTSIGQLRVLSCILLIMAGCRHASIQDDPNWPSPGPVDLASLPTIKSVINHGTTNPDTIRASLNQNPNKTALNPAQKIGDQNPIMLGAVNSPNPASPSVNLTLKPLPDHPPQEIPQAIQLPLSATPPTSLANPPAIVDNSPPPVIAPPVVQMAEPLANRPVETTSNLPATPLATGPSATAVTEPPAAPPVANTGATLSTPASQDLSQKLDTQTKPASAVIGPQASAAPANPGPLAGFSMEGLPETAVSAGRVAASVGKEVITVYDLNIAVQDWIRQNVPAGQSIPRRDGLMISRMVLNQMIDRMLIVQEAHRMMKSAKQKDALMSQIDRVWVEKQIPPMMKKYKVETVYDLDQTLRKQGRSLESAKKEVMNDAVAHEFMSMKLTGKTHVSLVEMRRYYNSHLTDFDRPAQLTWREIRIPIEGGNKLAADDKAKTILQQVQSGQDFASLAKTLGKGPTADQGGLWETSPGGFALPEINQALASLKPGQISGLIVTEQSFHLIKLESNREAGPARFDEVQTDIQNSLRNEKLTQASMGFVKDLRKQTVIVTIFDGFPQLPGPGSDSNVQKANASTPPPAELSTQSTQSPSPQSQPQEQAAPPQNNTTTGHGNLGLPHTVPLRSDDIPSTLAPSGPVPARGTMSGPSGPSPL